LLRKGFEREGLSVSLARQGSIFWLHQTPQNGEAIRRLEQIPAEHAERFKKIFHESVSRGVYLAPSGYEVGFIGYAHTDAVLAEAADLILSAVKGAHG